ncbi:MAG: DUF3078 domain-containing protein [Candidatus Cryptobacteroides sp.]
MKKRIIIIAALALCCLGAKAQDAVKQAATDAATALSEAPEIDAEPVKPHYWTYSAKLGVGFDMTSLSNWAAGGYNTTALKSSLDTKADYHKDLTSWTNRLQLDYGFLTSADKKGIRQKTNDRMYLESNWAYRTSKESKLSYSASFNFRSQFTDTPAEYLQDENGNWYENGIKSGFISPAYTDISLGIQWVPSTWFNVNISPLTGGFTICTNELLRQSYGMKLRSDELDPDLGSSYKSALFQFGAQVKANLKLVINENFTYETQAVVFTDYLNEPYVRINWDNAIVWQLSRFVQFSFKTWLISDPNVTVTTASGEAKKGAVQFKDYLSFNFTYTFERK